MGAIRNSTFLVLPTALLLSAINVFAYSTDGLKLMEIGLSKVFYSEEQAATAKFSGELCSEANTYFLATLDDIDVPFQLLVLSQEDWRKYTNPNIIYGMPHLKSDGISLVVAAEDNSFWHRQLPEFSALSSPYKELLEEVYSHDGQISGRSFFDLLAVHELSHAWHWAAGLNTQRLWLTEVFCNIMLHTFIAEKRPELLKALEILPAYWSHSEEMGDLSFTTLSEFEQYYNQLGLENPFNYAWYQYRFHHAAKLLYDEAGAEATKKLWDFFKKYPDNLSNDDLVFKLADEVHPYFRSLMEEW